LSQDDYCMHTKSHLLSSLHDQVVGNMCPVLIDLQKLLSEKLCLANLLERAPVPSAEAKRSSKTADSACNFRPTPSPPPPPPQF
jgi:hypothetical protein